MHCHGWPALLFETFYYMFTIVQLSWPLTLALNLFSLLEDLWLKNSDLCQICMTNKENVSMWVEFVHIDRMSMDENYNIKLWRCESAGEHWICPPYHNYFDLAQPAHCTWIKIIMLSTLSVSLVWMCSKIRIKWYNELL